MRNGSVSRIEHYKRFIELRRRQADVPLHQFCRCNGISTWTYYTWRRKLAALNGKAREAAVQAFVPVSVVARPKTPCLFQVVLPNGIIVRSGQQLDRDMLGVLAGIKGA